MSPFSSGSCEQSRSQLSRRSHERCGGLEQRPLARGGMRDHARGQPPARIGMPNHGTGGGSGRV
jgi:hypothetical protein